MIYFTADNHFGHENIIRFCNRPWKTAEEMDEAMIALWNERVRNNDTVFILGDLCFRAKDAENILFRLKGKKRTLGEYQILPRRKQRKGFRQIPKREMPEA